MSPILVTGVGGGVGQSIIKSFQGTDYQVVAADSFPLADGLYTARKSFQIPVAWAPEYIDRLLEICRSEGVRLLFSGLDEELPFLSAARDLFRQAGITA